MKKHFFSINLQCQGSVDSISFLLMSFPELHEWNVDFSQNPPVLIVDVDDDITSKISSAINSAGFKCKFIK